MCIAMLQRLQQAEAGAKTGGGVLHRAEACVPVCCAQEKLATKVRKKEITIRNLTTECERIRAKQALDELTAGQASTLARNERTIDILKEEVRDGWPLGCARPLQTTYCHVGKHVQAKDAAQLH